MAEQLTTGTSCVIGEGIQIKGKLTGSGDRIVRGRVQGEIILQDHLTIDESGIIEADITTKSLIINGRAAGNISACEAVSISAGATVKGDITANDLEIIEGAKFLGRLNMDVDLPESLLTSSVHKGEM